MRDPCSCTIEWRHSGCGMQSIDTATAESGTNIDTHCFQVVYVQLVRCDYCKALREALRQAEQRLGLPVKGV